MTYGEEQNTGEAADEKLRDYCVRIIRYLSDSALDPHLYFEKKLTGDVTVAETTEELLGILTVLIEWIDEMYGDSPGLAGLNRSLGRDGLPTLSLLCAPATRRAGLVLACGRIRTLDESRLMSELAENASLADTDRSIIERLLADHEQA